MQKPCDKSGNNINQKIDTKKLAEEFILWFYKNINENINKLFPDIWKEYSVIDINGDKIKGINNIYIQMNAIFSQTRSDLKSFQYILNGSRSIIILVTGIITKNTIIKNFSAVFQLSHNNSWFIKNLMINI